MNSSLKALLEKDMTRKQFLGAFFVMIVAVLGISALIKRLEVLADSATTASTEAESGTRTTLATLITDGSASGGNAIQFGSGNSWPALPTYPTVTWESLYHAGDSLQQTLARVTTKGTIVKLPNGFDQEISHAPMLGPENGNVLLYYPNIRGFVGNGPDQARFRIKKENYATFFTTMRLMDGRDGQNVNAGWSLDSSDQQAIYHDQSKTTHPANHAGYVLYYGRDAVFQNIRITGIQGDWNSPPGETFALNCYKDIGTKVYGYENDGWNTRGNAAYGSAGNRVGGSAFGMNNSTNAELYDCNFHDAYVSGPTASFTGGTGYLSQSSSSSGWKTVNCKFHRNANWGGSGGGKRFAGINHENVYGTILHERDDFIVNGANYWDAGHASIVHHLVDNPAITFLEPTWNPLFVAFKGAFVIGIQAEYPSGSANAQRTPPKVIKNGVSLTPYYHSTGAVGSSVQLPIDPTRQYVILGPDRRV